MTNSPTLVPTKNPYQIGVESANGIIFTIGILIGGSLVGCLFLLFFWKSRSERRLFSLQKEILIKKATELTAAPPVSTASDEVQTKYKEDKARLNTEYEKLMRKSKGVFVAVGDNFVVPLLESDDAQLVSEAAYHNGIGRAFVMTFIKTNDQVSFFLGWALTQFMIKLIETQVFAHSLTPTTTYATTIGITYALWILHMLMNMTVTTELTKRLGENTILYDPVPVFKRENKLA